MLVAYDPAWLHHLEETAEELRQLGDDGWLIEHIGSTAVPGMVAKPIIDVAVRVANDRDFALHQPGLEARRWRVGSRVRTHRVMVYESGGVRTRIAHFFDQVAWDTVNQRLLRDWLLANAADALLYQKAKLAAAANSGANPASYNAAKTAVIQEIVDRARAARGLVSVPVYDK